MNYLSAVRSKLDQHLDRIFQDSRFDRESRRIIAEVITKAIADYRYGPTGEHDQRSPFMCNAVSGYAAEHPNYTYAADLTLAFIDMLLTLDDDCNITMHCYVVNSLTAEEKHELNSEEDMRPFPEIYDYILACLVPLDL
ncbi:hypothetical protein MZD04_gp144 [Pseudomonas phage Psa21]|uniref:Uncharacterized protein n=1 Tax=Pseudomonas phage Psa21 TaxID=2530023 RepID=A0A481W4K1_9CAUD|nr:hypothetical protein MZD04_gp144 [Pseudomonas phage Psa21]QBJ02671.1 hypothetical protein PSA21_144 [Pseudomonas phage Psa21]